MECVTETCTADELEVRLLAAAPTEAHRCALHWANRRLRDMAHEDRMQFWLLPRGSLRGRTPLQALQGGDLHRLQEAAEAFAAA